MNPNELRLILIVLGVVVLLVIYLRGRHTGLRASQGLQMRSEAQDKSLDVLLHEVSLRAPKDTPASSEQLITPERPVTPGRSVTPEQPVTSGQPFKVRRTSGSEQLLAAMRRCGPRPPLSDPHAKDIAIDLSQTDPRNDAAISGRGQRPDLGPFVVAPAQQPTESPAAGPRVIKPPAERSPAVESSAVDPPPVARLPTAGPSEKLVVLYVAAREDELMRGDAIVRAGTACRLEFGEHNILHRIVQRNGKRQVVFSVANMVSPGEFKVDNMTVFRTPGLSLFMCLPGPYDGLKMFNEMLACAFELAQYFNASVRDDQRTQLTPDRVEALREEIQLFDLRHPRSASSSARGEHPA